MTQLSGIPGLLPAYIPSPSVGVWHLGPIPIRGYAMAILAGILVAVWLTQRRLVAQGERPTLALDVSAWAVPFGIVGGRLYHVMTDWEKYFAPGRHPIDALKIWQGGLGIWGAVALGAVGAWLGCRHYGLAYVRFLDAAAPGLAIAQAMGRVGNWFNNEIYGKPTDVPWKLQIHKWDPELGRAQVDAHGAPIVLGYFHPTFLYEALWTLSLAAFLIWIGHRFALKPGQTFAAYVMGYPIGRIVIENMRSDDATHILGQRVNTWTSILVFLIGLGLWFFFRRRAERAAAIGAPADGTDGESTERPGGDASDTVDTVDDRAAGVAGDADRAAAAEEPDGPSGDRSGRGSPTTGSGD